MNHEAGGFVNSNVNGILKHPSNQFNELSSHLFISAHILLMVCSI